jgi:transcriptional regulator with XRE-family HTH domain
MTAPSNASVRDHVRLVLEKLKSHQKERTSTAAEDKKVNPDRAEDNSRKAAFAERLKAAIERRGWSLTETARQTASVLGTDATFGRANLSHYLHGRSMPRARQLLALSHALGVRPDDLFPAGSLSRVEVIPVLRRAFMRWIKAMALCSWKCRSGFPGRPRSRS